MRVNANDVSGGARARADGPEIWRRIFHLLRCSEAAPFADSDHIDRWPGSQCMVRNTGYEETNREDANPATRTQRSTLAVPVISWWRRADDGLFLHSPGVARCWTARDRRAVEGTSRRSTSTAPRSRPNPRPSELSSHFTKLIMH